MAAAAMAPAAVAVVAAVEAMVTVLPAGCGLGFEPSLTHGPSRRPLSAHCRRKAVEHSHGGGPIEALVTHVAHAHKEANAVTNGLESGRCRPVLPLCD